MTMPVSPLPEPVDCVSLRMLPYWISRGGVYAFLGEGVTREAGFPRVLRMPLFR